jgi:hypothetical protein
MIRQQAPAGCIEGAIRLTLSVGGLEVKAFCQWVNESPA